MKDADLGDFLTAQRIANAQVIAEATERQLEMGGRLDTSLLDMGAVGESRLLKALGRFFRAKTVNGSTLMNANPDVIRLISPRVAMRFGVVPFRIEGKKLSVACVNPGDIFVEDELNVLTDCMVNMHVCLEIRLSEALARFYGVPVPARVASVIRRFANGSAAGAVKAETPAEESAQQPATEYTTVSVKPPQKGEETVVESLEDTRPALPKTKKDRPVVLELSEDELEEFPSMRHGHQATETVAPPPLPEPASAEDPSEEMPRAALEKEEPQEVSEEPITESPNERLVAASLGLLRAEMREEIGDAMLYFCEPYLRRRMLFIVRKNSIIGWRGEGEGMDETAIRAIEISKEDPSVFSGFSQGQPFWLGPLPSLPMNLKISEALGDADPSECVVLPVSLRDKPVCFLYGDNLGDSVGGVPVAELRRLSSKASLAFQVYILKSKIRRL